MKNKKIICGLLSLSMIVPGYAGLSVFAEGEDIAASQPAYSAEATLSEPTASPTASPDGTDTGETENVNVGVNVTIYTTDTENVYRVIFSTADDMPEIDSFVFRTTIEGSTVTNVVPGSGLSGANQSVGNNQTITIDWSSEESTISGSATICSALVSIDDEISADNLTVDSFTATRTDGETSVDITFVPELDFIEGVNMPEMSEDEEAVYNQIIALPAASELSYYRTPSDTSTLLTSSEINNMYATPAQEAIDAYNALSRTSQATVDTALSIDNIEIDDVQTLRSAATAMREVIGVMQIRKNFSGVENNDDAINYEYLSATYESVSKTTPDNLRPATTAIAELEAAKSEIETYVTYVDSALDQLTGNETEVYQTRIASYEMQYDTIKQNSTDTYYETYLTSLRNMVNSTVDDIEENYTGSYKEYLIADLNEILSNMDSDEEISQHLPTFTVPDSIYRNIRWQVTVTRNSSISNHDANVTVRLYNKSTNELIDEAESAFASGDTELTIGILASPTTYPSDTNVYISVYYEYNGTSYYLGQKDSIITRSTSPTSSDNMANGWTSSGSGSSGDNTGSNTSGTIYPDVSPTASPTYAPSLVGDNPYTDIDNYEWAQEAIIGLTNAGIVNGMGDGEFNPAGEVTREQFCKMVVLMFGVYKENIVTSFNDVDPNAWYTDYVASAVEAGYVEGQSDEYFGIGESIMRQDMATILYRALGQTGDEVELTFSDVDNIADYAKNAVAELVGLNVINGYTDGTFLPRGTATRAEAAKMVWEVYNIIY
mgnify:CR=1 FL=1